MSGLLGVFSFLHTVLSMAENVANSIRILVLDYEIVQELFEIIKNCPRISRTILEVF